MPSNHLILGHPLLLLPFPASESFPVSQFFQSGDQIIGASALASVLPMDIQNRFPLGLTGDLLVIQGALQHHSSKASILQRSAFFLVQLSHWYMTTGKTIALTRQTFVSKVMSLLFNMLSKSVIAFLPRSKDLLFHGCSHHLQWFWSPRKQSLSLFPLFLNWFIIYYISIVYK